MVMSIFSGLCHHCHHHHLIVGDNDCPDDDVDIVDDNDGDVVKDDADEDVNDSNLNL